MRKGCLTATTGTLVGVALLLTAIYFWLDRENKKLDEDARAGLPGKFVALPFGAHGEVAYTHYLEDGPANGPVVLLVHGFSGPATTWERTMPALAAAGFRVLAPDLFGRGFSDRVSGPYDENLFVNQIDQFLTALDIRQPVDLVGLSMGGYVAAGFAARYPERVRRVALLAPQSIVISSDPRMGVVTMPVFGDYLFTVLIAPFFIADSSEEFTTGVEPEEITARYREAMQYRGLRAALLSTLRTMNGDPFEQYVRLGRLDRPVLLLWGEDDRTVPASNAPRVAAAIPQAELHLLPNARHALAYERPESVNPLLVEFFQR